MLGLTSGEIFGLVCSIVGGLISLLLLGNFFFLKKLIHKIDSIDGLSANVGMVGKRLDELVGRMELVNDLRIEVATLKTRLSGMIHRRPNGFDDEAELPT